jgi:hypothetical protein
MIPAANMLLKAAQGSRGQPRVHLRVARRRHGVDDPHPLRRAEDAQAMEDGRQEEHQGRRAATMEREYFASPVAPYELVTVTL